MRKLFTLIVMTMILSMFTGCSYLKRAEKKKQAAKLNDIRVTFVTTQGEVNFFLYPEAAPITVANFINLGKRGYYNDNRIHRAVDNFIVQAGDPTETGQGGPGYVIPDEIVEWLDFYQQGMLAMANAGPRTGGSQYFFTLYPADWLNEKHTVFGEVVSDGDFNVIQKLEVGDVIREVKFTGPSDFFLSLHKEQIEEWNAILDENFPELEKYPIKNTDEFGEQVLQYKEELERLYTPQEVEQKEEKEYFMPRTIRKIEKAIIAKKAAKLETEIVGEAAETTQLSEMGEASSLPVEEAPATEVQEAAVEAEVSTSVAEEAAVPAQLPEVEEAEEVEMEKVTETTDSPDKVEVEEVDDELGEVDSLDDLNETKKSIWDKMKFWKRDSKEVKEIG